MSGERKVPLEALCGGTATARKVLFGKSLFDFSPLKHSPKMPIVNELTQNKADEPFISWEKNVQPRITGESPLFVTKIVLPGSISPFLTTKRLASTPTCMTCSVGFPYFFGVPEMVVCASMEPEAVRFLMCYIASNLISNRTPLFGLNGLAVGVQSMDNKDQTNLSFELRAVDPVASVHQSAVWRELHRRVPWSAWMRQAAVPHGTLVSQMLNQVIQICVSGTDGKVTSTRTTTNNCVLEAWRGTTFNADWWHSNAAPADVLPAFKPMASAAAATRSETKTAGAGVGAGVSVVVPMDENDEDGPNETWGDGELETGVPGMDESFYAKTDDVLEAAEWELRTYGGLEAGESKSNHEDYIELTETMRLVMCTTNMDTKTKGGARTVAGIAQQSLGAWKDAQEQVADMLKDSMCSAADAKVDQTALALLKRVNNVLAPQQQRAFWNLVSLIGRSKDVPEKERLLVLRELSRGSGVGERNPGIKEIKRFVTSNEARSSLCSWMVGGHACPPLQHDAVFYTRFRYYKNARGLPAVPMATSPKGEPRHNGIQLSPRARAAAIKAGAAMVAAASSGTADELDTLMRTVSEMREAGLFGSGPEAKASTGAGSSGAGAGAGAGYQELSDKDAALRRAALLQQTPGVRIATFSPGASGVRVVPAMKIKQEKPNNGPVRGAGAGAGAGSGSVATDEALGIGAARLRGEGWTDEQIAQLDSILGKNGVEPFASRAAADAAGVTRQ